MLWAFIGTLWLQLEYMVDSQVVNVWGLMMQ